MPKDQVSDPITDQEIAFAHLVLSATMTDRRAAEAVGLNPDTAAYTNAKPCVRAYMLQHQATVHERLVEQETDLTRRAVEGLRRLNPGREQVLARLWEIANLSPEMTRSSVSGQVKALSMIVAIEGLIPDRRAVSSEKKSVPPPTGRIYESAWLREQQGKTTVPQPSPAPAEEEQEDSPTELSSRPERSVVEGPAVSLAPSEPTSVHPFSTSETTPSSPHARVPDSAPDNRVPFSIKVNPSTWRLRL